MISGWPLAVALVLLTIWLLLSLGGSVGLFEIIGLSSYAIGSL